VRCAWLAGEGEPRGYERFAWVAPEELELYALPLAQKRISSLLHA
jgi:hypothetical protein